MKAATARIEAIVAECESRDKAPRPEVVIGETYTGEVKSVMPFGIFVELVPGLDGFCHISELSESFVRNIEDVGLTPGDVVTVEVTTKNEKGQYRVKRIEEGQQGAGSKANNAEAPTAAPQAKGKRGGGGGGRKRTTRGGTSDPSLSPSSAEASEQALREEAALSAALTGLADDPVD